MALEIAQNHHKSLQNDVFLIFLSKKFGQIKKKK